MNNTNQKIIDAIIAKAEKICPDSLALIGIYGSVATGDIYEKSDLDLLILIQDDEGWKLGTGFILEDSQIGYDIYCTNWGGLKYDSECHHAQISKLMDSKIVYIKNQEAYDELCRLREQTKAFLQSKDRFKRVYELIDKAKIAFANSYLRETIAQVRIDAFGVILYLLDALMLYHGTYFKRGTKRTFEELATLPIADEFACNLRKIPTSKDICEIREVLKTLLSYVEGYVQKPQEKQEPSASLAGTYEEMYSNWRNKVEKAATENDAYSSFMNMASLHYMLQDISSENNIGTYDIMEEYNPDNLTENVKIYDQNLAKYEDVYKKAGLSVKRFANVDDFVGEYLK